MRSSSDQLQLFDRAHLSDALRSQTGRIPLRVQSISESVLRARTNEDIAAELVEELRVVPIELFRDRATMAREEVQIDVSGDPGRDIFPRGKSVFVPGIRVVVSIPYRGDKELWYLLPSTFQLSAPWGAIRVAPTGSEGTLEIIFKQPTDESLERIKTDLDRRLRDIEFFLSHQRTDLAGYDGQLQRDIVLAVENRRARLSKHDNLSLLLGIPEANAPVKQTVLPTPKIETPVLPTATVIPSTSTWDVFVSHASEDKDIFARPLADALRKARLTVWFDEKTLRLGDSLRRSIDRGLAQSRFGIVILSRAFLSKEWPQRELDGLVAREEDGQKIVLPIWHDITAAEIRRRSPTLADRLAIPSSKGLEAVVEAILEVVRPV